MTLTAQERADLVSKCFCVPVAIILNYSLFQYLLTVFYSRRRDPHVRLLLTAAFFSFATLIPFSYPDEDLVHNLNDISEVCSILTFTQQIAILTRGISKKMKLPLVAELGHIAELLVFLGLVLLTCNVANMVAPEAEGMDTIELLDTVIEYVTLVFVVAFRFYFLAVARGWAVVWRSQKLEVIYYLLFLTHAIPFQIATGITGLHLHLVQALWMRVTIALCLSSTIRAKIASMSSVNTTRATSTGGGGGRRPIGATFTVGAVDGGHDGDGQEEETRLGTAGPATKRIMNNGEAHENSRGKSTGKAWKSKKSSGRSGSQTASQTMTGAMKMARLGLSSSKVTAFVSASPSTKSS
jgi:hypothetical protein